MENNDLAMPQAARAVVPDGIEPVPVSPVPASIPIADPIYIVWSPTGEAPAKVQHPTHRSAHASAWHLAKKHPGQQFYVMRKHGVGALVSMAEASDA